MKRQSILLLAIVILSAASNISLGGVLIAWGNNDYGQCDVPEGNDFVAITATRFFALALRSNGTLAGWGSPWSVVTDLPDGNDFVAVSTREYHGLALKRDGTVVAWGRNDEGQCDVPAGRYIAISAGVFHSLAIDVNGTIVEWPFYPIEPNMVPMPEGSDFVAVEGGRSHSLVLRSNGQLEAWRSNESGECNVPDGNYIDMAIRACHGCFVSRNFALNTNGQIVSWSCPHTGTCDVPDGNGYQDVAPGVAIDANGALVAWSDCLLKGPPEANEPSGPNILPQGNGFVAVDTAECFGIALASSETQTLTVSVEPNFIDSITPSAGIHTHYYGEWVRIDAPPHPNCPDVYRFAEWQGDVSDPNSATQYITMTADKSIKAIYTAAERLCGDECHPIVQGDVNEDCYVNFEDFVIYADNWLSCTHPDCD